MKLKNFVLNYFPELVLTQPIDFSSSLSVLTPEKRLNDILSWPPNIFLIIYSVLDFTDKYRKIVSPTDDFSWRSSHVEEAKNLSLQWLDLLSQQLNFQDHINKSSCGHLLEKIRYIFSRNALDEDVYTLLNNPEYLKELFILFISIDELFSNASYCNNDGQNPVNFHITMRKWLLDNTDNLSDAHGKLGFITLKSSVPQSGLTINNLTQYLTSIKPSVKPKIVVNKFQRNGFNKKSLNILLLPWPNEIKPSFFKESKKVFDIDMNDFFGFFSYAPETTPSDTYILSAIEAAQLRAGAIDLIVFPECALSERVFDRFTNILYKKFGEDAPSILSGIYCDLNGEQKNSAKLSFIGETKKYDSIEQKKHHRWFLDKNQLRNYNLATSLDPDRKWWEDMNVERRNLLMLHSANGLKLCPLICEDLARQEPVAQSVRSVGPNLVISLLLDGPQISQRWPGKYSAVLSDDPGSSVLSFTSLGMTLRSTGLGNPPSRAVALWSEPQKGSETLNVDEGAIGIVMELEIKNEDMWSMDGRNKEKPVVRKIFHSSIYLEENRKSATMIQNRPFVAQ
ncbi:hypothetical protein [Aeromonas veronii]|uniref:hypothetical protein n=1 Tax=Aeromonas veronii TaxID=654 RepID=UPI003BA30640